MKKEALSGLFYNSSRLHSPGSYVIVSSVLLTFVYIQISTTSLLTDQHHEEAGFQTLLHSQHNGTPQCPHTPHYSFCISTPYTLVFPLILVFLYALIPLYICIPDHLDILYTSVFLKTLVSCLLQYPMHFSIPIHPVHFKFKVIYTIPHSTTLGKCLL